MPSLPRRRRIGRKLLVASLGVAAVNYVACSSSSTTGTNNDPDASATDGSSDQFVSGNLMPQPDTGHDSNIEDAPLDQLVANLVPPPADAGNDGAGD